MIRNMKALGLALIAVFALSAMGASAASAQKGMITSATNPFWLHGTDEPAPAVTALTAFGGTAVKCTTVTYTGGKVGSTSPEGDHVGLTSGVSDVTVTPDYTNCHVNGTLPATITMNGCDYVIHIEKTNGITDQYAATAELVCPAGKEVTLDIYLSAESHANHPLTPDCLVHIPAQKGLAGATLTDETNGHLTLGGTAKGITMTRTAGPCGALETTKAGELHLAATLEGRSAVTGGGVNVPLKLSHL